MPRKIDPKWGVDGWYDAPELSISTAQAERIAAIAGITDWTGTEQIRHAVQEIGEDYRRWTHKDEYGPTRAEARKALADVLQNGGFSPSTLQHLNCRAYDALLDALWTTPRANLALKGDESVLLALIGGNIPDDAVRRAIEKAITLLKAKSGPNRKGNLQMTVDRLCDLYEELTGRKATQLAKPNNADYDGLPCSEAGRFAAACMEIISPGLLPQSISTAMSRFIKRRSAPKDRAN